MFTDTLTKFKKHILWNQKIQYFEKHKRFNFKLRTEYDGIHSLDNIILFLLIIFVYGETLQIKMRNILLNSQLLLGIFV